MNAFPYIPVRESDETEQRRLLGLGYVFVTMERDFFKGPTEDAAWYAQPSERKPARRHGYQPLLMRWGE